MSSIASVVTRGYGSFGSVNLLPTLGYGASQVVLVITTRSFYRPQPIAVADSLVGRIDVADQRVQTIAVADQQVQSSDEQVQ